MPRDLLHGSELAILSQVTIQCGDERKSRVGTCTLVEKACLEQSSPGVSQSKLTFQAFLEEPPPTHQPTSTPAGQRLSPYPLT